MNLPVFQEYPRDVSNLQPVSVFSMIPQNSGYERSVIVTTIGSFTTDWGENGVVRAKYKPLALFIPRRQLAEFFTVSLKMNERLVETTDNNKHFGRRICSIIRLLSFKNIQISCGADFNRTMFSI